MTLLVIGRTGQVALALQALAAQRGLPLLALDRSAADLTDPEACARTILDHAARHDIRAVINAAAWTAVDAAEDDEAAATVVNGAAPGAMARSCAALGIPFVHISTDYVFDGSGTAPWHPDSPTGPLGAYGRSKLAGEQAVAAAGGTFAILRTAWVFSAHGSNFVKTMLRLGASRDQLAVVADQTGGPTPADAIGNACLTMADALVATPRLGGIYHLAGSPDTSWADFATAIFAQSGLPCRVQPIPAAYYPTKAQRPANSRLDCTTTARAFGIPRPDWRAGLAAVLHDLKGPAG